MDTMLLINSKFGNQTDFYEQRILWSLAVNPDWAISTHNMFVNLPIYNYISQTTMDETIMQNLLIKVKDPANVNFIQKLAEKLDKATSESVTTHIVYEEKTDMSAT